MRNNFFKQIQLTAAFEELTPEESAMADRESDQTLDAMHGVMGDVSRLEDTADGVFDTIIIVDKTPIISEVQQSLLSSVGDMAAAGMDIAGEDIVPAVALESNVAHYVEPTYHKLNEKKEENTSDLRKKLKEIWEAILKFLSKIWEHVKHFLTYFYDSAEKLKRHVTSTLEFAKNIPQGAQPKKKEVVIYDLRGAASVNGESFLGGAFANLFGVNTAEVNMKNFNKTIAMLVKQAPVVQKKIGEDVLGTIKSFDPKDPSGSVDKHIRGIYDDMDKYATLMMGAIGTTTLRKKPGERRSRGLIGNFHLTVKGFKEKPAEEESLAGIVAKLAAIRFGTENDEFKTAPNGYVIIVGPVMRYVNDLEQFNQIADLLLSYKTQHVGEDIAKISEEIKNATKNLVSDSKPVSDEAARVAKELIKLNAAYANWGTQPTLAAMQRIVRACLFFVDLDRKCLGAYKAVKAESADEEPAAA